MYIKNNLNNKFEKWHPVLRCCCWRADSRERDANGASWRWLGYVLDRRWQTWWVLHLSVTFIIYFCFQ